MVTLLHSQVVFLTSLFSTRWPFMKCVNSHVFIISPPNSSGHSPITVLPHGEFLKFIRLLPTSTINSWKISVCSPSQIVVCLTLAIQFSVGHCDADPVYLQVFRVPEDVPVPEPASEPHDEAQRHPAVHLQRVWHGVHPVAPPETAHAHSQSRFK